MKRPTFFAGFSFILSIWMIMACSRDGNKIASIYCENKINPAGVATSGFRFSWKLESPERNIMQSAYRLVLTDGLSGTFNEEDLIWDSGKIMSDQSILVPYGGPKLAPGSNYRWKVKVWDMHGNEFPWSNPGNFITGLEAGEWNNAEWIALDELDPDRRIVPGIPSPWAYEEWRQKSSGDHILPLFRKEFTVRDQVSSALVFVSGLGHYELRLNGNKVGDHFLAPGWTDYDDQCLYNIYDVTDRIVQGDNSLGMMLGNGFYIVPNSRYRKLITAYGNPKMILMLKLIFKDGSSEVLVSDGSWKASGGPITYSSIYGGENYNATFEQANWDRPGFEDSGWVNAIRVQSPSKKLHAELDYPVKVQAVLEPVSITRIGDGDKFLYDFGQNASGIMEISVRGNRGDTVKLIPSELIKDNFEAEQSATGRPSYFIYVLKGEGTETWSPRFSYTGFRYVQVEGAVPDSVESYLPKILGINMLHTRNSSPVSGEFHTSFELFNQINSLILWAIRSNFQSVLTDCPHREKLGWLEQSYLMGGSVHYNLNVYHLYCKLIDDMMNAQTGKGMVPGIAPEYCLFEEPFRDIPEWGSASVILPWLVYRWYGDTAPMEQAWGMMSSYVEYLGSRAEKYILSHGLGDWFDHGPRRPGMPQLTPIALSATAIYYHDLELLGRMALILGKTKEAEKYEILAGQVKDAFNARFFDPQTGVYSTGSQTAMSMPLALGLVEEDYRVQVLSNLADSIEANGRALTAGDVGFHFLVKALQDGGAEELLYEMNARDDVPGYGYQLKMGATALTESWPALRIVSNNHLMLGHLMEWFYGGLAGIGQTDQSIAYKEIWISPQFPGDIRSASAVFESPYGRIGSNWEKTGEGLIMEINIPVNTHAKIRFPTKDVEKIMEGDRSIEHLEGMEILSEDEKGITIRIGSGHYMFTIG